MILNQKQLTVADVWDVCLKLDAFMLGGESCTRVKLEGKNKLVASCLPPVYIVGSNNRSVGVDLDIDFVQTLWLFNTIEGSSTNSFKYANMCSSWCRVCAVCMATRQLQP